MLAFHVSLSGVRAGLDRLAVSANNVANVRTPGFRASRADQADLRGGGASVDSIRVLQNQGPIETDAGPFQMAVVGDGFFRIGTPAGDRFTRAGTFQVDAQGNLVTPDGYPLQPPIQVPADASSFHVAADGRVSANLADGTTQDLGRLDLARFPNPGGLVQEGDNLASAGPASGNPVTGAPGSDGFGQILFGALEGSNVDLTTEIVGRIADSFAVKANLKAIKAQDETLGDLLDLKG